MLQGFDYSDLGGGLNEGPAHQVQSRQMRALRNFYPYGTRLRRRGGVRRLTTGGAWDQNITGMFPLKKSDGTWVLVVSGGSKFGRLDSETIVDLSTVGGLSLADTSHSPTFFMYKDFLYALRQGNNGLMRLTSTTVSQGGISRPTAAHVIADGGAGDLTAGDYIAVHTYYNRATAMESNPSDPSNTLTLGASREIDHSGITVSADPFVDARRVYRVLVDQVGVYFFAGQINDNITTTLTEDQSVTELGRTVSFDNGVPPSTLLGGVIWNERLMAHDGTDLFFSELLLPECFGDESIIPVFPDDGHKIIGLHAFGDRLIIGKTNKMHFLVGNDRASFGLQTLSDHHGCRSHHSMQSAEGQLFWYGTGKSVFKSDGTNVSEISTVRVKETLSLIPDDLEEFIVGAIDEAKNQYLLSIPTSDEDDNNHIVLVYNYKTDVWTTYDHTQIEGAIVSTNSPQYIGDFFNEDYGHVLYSTFYDGHVYQYGDESYTSDFGNAIHASFTTKKDAFGYPGFRKFLDEVWMIVPRVPGATLRLEVLQDELSSAVRDRTVSLNIDDGASEWKAYKLATMEQPGTALSLRVSYSGATAIDIDALKFTVGTLNRAPSKAY